VKLGSKEGSMLDSPRPANLCLSVAVAVVLALGVTLVTIASCGSLTTDAPRIISPSPPDDSPADVTPTPATAGSSPTESAKATIPVQEEATELLGAWANDQNLVLELGGNGVYTLSRGSGQPDAGTWSLQENGSLVLEGQSYAAIPHGNLLLLGGTDATFTLDILQRVDNDGNLLAYEPASAIEVPPIDLSAVLTVTIGDHWTGLSPLAPIEAQFHLEPTTEHFSGMAEFSVAGYTEAITRSVPISVPLAVIEELLAFLESTPLEVGEYQPVFNHTDDFPSIMIAIEGSAGDLGFATESQGSRHIPWRVVVGQDHYVTYADTPAQALDLLDPYLAREVQEALFDLALARDP
jgi:hypothetical protein